MILSSKVISGRSLKKGEESRLRSVFYGSSRRSPVTRLLSGTVIGYAVIPKAVRHKVNAGSCNVAGRVSMDMITIRCAMPGKS